MGCSLRGLIVFPFIDCKCNERKVNKYCFFSNTHSIPTFLYIHDIFLSQPIIYFGTALDVMLMTGEKFHFSQVFPFRGKTSVPLHAVIYVILDF